MFCQLYSNILVDWFHKNGRHKTENKNWDALELP